MKTNDDVEKEQTKVTISRSGSAESGIFIDSLIVGLEVPMLLDTGASRTIISQGVYKRIPEERRPPILQAAQCPRLELADGTRLAVDGCVDLQIQVDSVVVNHEVVIAAISDEGILGLDFLNRHRCRIDVSKNEMIINGETISGTEGSSRDFLNKVCLLEKTVFPARSETVIKASLELKSENALCVVDAAPDAEERYQIKVAASLCDPSSKEVPVRILNPSTHDVLLNKGTVVGLATEVVEEVSFLQRENEEYDNTGCVKTVQTTAELSWPDNSDITDKEAKLSSVPDHLKDLFQSSCENLNEDERTKLADLPF